jgi:hypothetical protein
MAFLSRTKTTNGSTEAEEELRHDAELRQAERLENEQVHQQVVNQGVDTGTHSSSHRGVDWGPSYRVKRPRPTKDQIEARAYEIYLARGAKHGLDLDDWLSAERELTLS